MENQKGYRTIQTNENEREIKTSGCCESIRNLSKDAVILILSKAVRMFAFGFLAVVLVLYLLEMDLTSESVGLLFSLTLIGDVLISLVMTSHADRFGRKKTLLIGSVLTIVTSYIFATQANFWVLVVTATFGIITPSGNEIGPFQPVELSSLSEVTPEPRTMLLAWYNMFGSFSSALGSLCCGFLIHFFQNYQHMTILESYRGVMLIYAFVQTGLVLLFACLSDKIEISNAKVKNANPVSLFLGLHKSKGIVLKLSALFIIDSFGGSFVLTSFMSGWFEMVYHTAPATLGGLIFVCNLVAGISALFAAQLANRIGLIMTMFVTHLPSNILLILVPLMPNQTLAIVMLCLRFSISQMDVPTRNAFVQTVVEPDERSGANGVANVVRSIGAAVGPYIAGILYARQNLQNTPWYISGGLKVLYDILLVLSFSTPKAPETAKLNP